MSHHSFTRYLAELAGTFALVFVGCGAIVLNDTYSLGLGDLGISMAFGLVVFAMIVSLGNISGAHINPAVSVAFCVLKRLPTKDLAPYIVAQCLGASLAAWLLTKLLPAHDTLGATLSSLAIPLAYFIEILLSFVLMLSILIVTATRYEHKLVIVAVVVALTVLTCAFFGGPFTGASMNPARSLGPALASGQLELLWLYLSAPVVGMLLACPFCKLICREQCCE